MLVEFRERPVKLVVDPVIVELSGHEMQVREQRIEHIWIWATARESLDRVARDLPEILVRLLPPRHPDQLEALGQRPLVCKVVERRQQLAVRKVAGGPK